MGTPLEVVKAQLEHYNNHNLDGFCEQFSDGIEIYDLPDNTLRFKGIEEFRVRYKNYFEDLKPNAKLVNRIELGNKIIDHEHLTKAGYDGILDAVAIYLVEGGKISKAWFLMKWLSYL